MDLKHRLKTNDEFKNVLDGRHSLKYQSFKIYYVKNSLNYSRFGLSVSKKVGNAVTRNLIKRRFRANIKDVCDLDGLCLDIVVIAQKSVVEMNFSEIQSEFKQMNLTLKEKLNEKKD